MREYILYHNATEMGYDLEGNDLLKEFEGINTFSLSLFDESQAGDMGWEYFAGDDELEEYEFSIVTNNKKEVGDSINQRVWVIQGEAFTSPRRYYLHGFFYPLVAEKKPIKIGDTKFQYRLLGREDGLRFPLVDACYLDRSGWFGGFLRYYQNFRVGFREIKDSAWIAELEEIYENTLKQ